MTKLEQELQTASAFANIITLVVRTATDVAGENGEEQTDPDNETIHLIGSKLQKKLAPHART